MRISVAYIFSRLLVIFRLIWPVLLALFWCEFLVYYVTLAGRCAWPKPPVEGVTIVKTMVLTDIHLLGNIRGHPLDKLKREWQMYRSFQTAVSLFGPELIIIVGDTFDEGQIASEQDFRQYTRRFKELFYVGEHIKMITVVGNHDVGFHDRMITFEPFLRRRFERAFNATLVELITYKGINIVSLNSMSMEADGCTICSEAKTRIRNIAKELFECSDYPADEVCYKSRPILASHFPLFRKSDVNCSGPDSMPQEEKSDKFREKIDCISKPSSDFILQELNPRLVFSGHTHHGCLTKHGEDKIPEYTLASFNWRNKHNPSFVLANLSPEAFEISTCMLPDENIVNATYALFVIAFLANLVYVYQRRRRLL